MLLTNIKIAFRRLQTHPAFTAINAIGLTLGLMVFFYILQYVVFQPSYNGMYTSADRTFRLLEGISTDQLTPLTAPGIAPLVKQNIPGVELATRFVPNLANGIVLVEGNSHGMKNQNDREDNFAFVDDDFLKIFNRPAISGITDLTLPNTVILTRSKAYKYFATTEVAAKEIKLLNQFGEHPLVIQGVIENFPVNSDLRPAALFSLTTLESKEYLG